MIVQNVIHELETIQIDISQKCKITLWKLKVSLRDIMFIRPNVSLNHYKQKTDNIKDNFLFSRSRQFHRLHHKHHWQPRKSWGHAWSKRATPITPQWTEGGHVAI